ncbi:MAG TPA: ribonuclease P protein component, partial [Chloroflexota bacterium]|nr:ribonuclease P protein component [Chloroflexota bacterium]
KRVGRAVVRNRVRRRLREIVRALLPRLAPGWDLALAARNRASQATFDELRRAVEGLMGRARLLRQAAQPAQ